ncbi:MAG TPA: hypothetical protein VFZ09_01195 [Archangium sp.]|uniref:hypothetical protein n=1 Tax=Archangium sp. TaxID=1872627 RepID=UPI002E2F1B66|nr:hypothetical protein [Archangium sp.]HEX5744824.1 hypothetical protein [Archangium sp.]
MNVDPVQVAEALVTIITTGVVAALGASRAVRGKLGSLVAEVMKAEWPALLKSLRKELRPVVRAVVREEVEHFSRRLANLEGAFYERHGQRPPLADASPPPSPAAQHTDPRDGQP